MLDALGLGCLVHSKGALASQPMIPSFICFLNCRSLLSQSTSAATASLGFLPIQIKFLLMALIEIGV